MLPFVFLRFWFIDSPKNLIAFFASLNNAFLQLFSLPLLVNTYFKPWKNEYREGLVRTAIVVGVVFKTILIFFDLFLFGALLALEVVIFVGWFALPAFVLISLYGAIFA